MVPSWLHLLSWLAVLAGISSSLKLAWSVRRHQEHMAIMNWVWPLVALAGGPLVIWLYNRQKAHHHGEAPFALATAVATCHCGAGCTLGDIIAETAATAAPGILVWFGLGSLFAEPIFAGWVLDFVAAFLLGIVFQYFSIAPMRGLGLKDGIVAALKADAMSLAAWQVGMYGVMALVQFGWMRLAPDSAEFWFAMQVAMLGGFAASYPVNWWLLKAGIKEKM
jgi:hypothetical protein